MASPDSLSNLLPRTRHKRGRSESGSVSSSAGNTESTDSTETESASDDTEIGSLKRKGKEDTFLASSRPQKKSRSESADMADEGPPSISSFTDDQEMSENVEDTSTAEQAPCHVVEPSEAIKQEAGAIPSLPSVKSDDSEIISAEDIQHPTPPVLINNIEAPCASNVTAALSTSRTASAFASYMSIGSSFPTIHSANSVKSGEGFSAFAGSRSPFDLSTKRDSSSSSSRLPAWRINDLESLSTPMDEIPITKPGHKDNGSDALGAGHESEKESIEIINGGFQKHPEEALAAHNHIESTHHHVTGEEDENVEAELKGVRLFVKRGDKEFTDCSFGHIKLLSHRTTSNERLVFRRDQVLKLSMNVGLRSTVRCIHNAEDHVLRVILKEPIPSEDGKPENHSEAVTIYVLKAGKAAKKDFDEFARTIVDSPRLPPTDVSKT